MAYSLSAGGKRLRPVLVLLAAECCGGDTESAMPAACAVELVHTYSLVHDDLPTMDDDDLRRGQPTCHIAFDEATALLVGDGLLTYAFEVLAVGLPPTIGSLCCAKLAAAAGAANMVGGQADDLACESVDRSQLDLTLLESIHRRKTGAMFRVSLELGGIVAGANQDQLGWLDDYGQNMGLAFQIVDDLLDWSGDERALGKRAKKDNRRGKLTFPGLIGVEASRKRAMELVNRAEMAATALESQPLVELAKFVLDRNR